MCSAHFLIGADGFGVAIALPALQADLALTTLQGQWVLTAYGAAFAGLLLVAGRVADFLGQRRLLAAGLAVFATGSLLAGLSRDLSFLIGARALQGAGAAAAVPASLALAAGLYPPGPARARALALVGGFATAGMAAGLVAGGAIVQTLGWHAVFLIFAPVAALAAVAAPAVLSVSPPSGGERPRVTTSLVLVGATVALLIATTGVARSGALAASTIAAAATGLLGLLAFAVAERRVERPLIPRAAWALPAVPGAIVGVAGTSMVFTAAVYVAPLYLQTAAELSALRAGLALLPTVLGALAVSLTAGRAIARRSPRRTAAAGFVLSAAAFVWLARVPSQTSYTTDVLPSLALLGPALSVAFIVVTQQALADVPPSLRGVVAGLFETSQHLAGGAFGVALYATLITAGGFRLAFLAAGTAAALAAITTRSLPIDPSSGQRTAARDTAPPPLEP